jgi:guanylate kinase
VSRPEGRKGTPFVVAAPSGTGKTTVCQAVLERDSGIRFSVSHTTREPRAGERDGVDYHFVSPLQFRRLVDQDGFLEHAEYGGNCYGTSRWEVEEALEAGLDLLLEIEVQGAAQVRERRDDARLIFLLPPHMGVLAERLHRRGTDSPETIERRLAVAHQELAAAELFDYAVVNDRLEEAVDSVIEIVEAERSGRPDAARERHGRADVLKRWGGGDDPG